MNNCCSNDNNFNCNPNPCPIVCTKYVPGPIGPTVP